MAMDDFILMQQQKDPSDTTELDVQIQGLETRLRSKHPQAAIVPLEVQDDVVLSEIQGHIIL